MMAIPTRFSPVKYLALINDRSRLITGLDG